MLRNKRLDLCSHLKPWHVCFNVTPFIYLIFFSIFLSLWHANKRHHPRSTMCQERLTSFGMLAVEFPFRKSTCKKHWFWQYYWTACKQKSPQSKLVAFFSTYFAFYDFSLLQNKAIMQQCWLSWMISWTTSKIFSLSHRTRLFHYFLFVYIFFFSIFVSCHTDCGHRF